MYSHTYTPRRQEPVLAAKLTVKSRKRRETYLVGFSVICGIMILIAAVQSPPPSCTPRALLDPYFLGMFRPSGRAMAGVQGERGDSSDVSGSSGSTQRRFTWWLREWEDGTSRTVTRLSASTFPVGTEGRASGTRSPIKLKRVYPSYLST